MTQPIGQGFPDWGRQISIADVLIARQDTDIAAPATLGPFYVGNAPFVEAAMNPGGVRGLALLEFYEDEALTRILGRDTVTFAPSGLSSVSIPVAGPWVSVTLELAAYPNNPFFSLIMTSSPTVRSGLESEAGILLSVFNTAIGAGAVITVDALVTRAGIACWSLAVGSATWAAELYALTMAGGTSFLCETNQANARQPFMVCIPPRPIRCIIRNTGAASTYNLGLTMRPFHGGG